MGTGLVMHVIAKVVFVLVGYSIHMFLGKTLSAATYGSIGVILSIININYNFLSNGARQAASHLIAANKYNTRDLIFKSYKYQLIIALFLSIGNFCGADLIANILNQPELKKYIQITAIMIPFTALYFISVGIMNGFKLLVFEALTVTIYPIMRLSIIPLVKYAFRDAVYGTICGFFAAAIVGCIVGNVFLLKKARLNNSSKTNITNVEYAKQIVEFLAFFLCITVVLNLDMLFVNALVTDESQVGYYTGATNLSKVCYYLLSAIYLVALPMVTHAYSEQNLNKCTETINQLLTLICGFILPIVAIAGPLSGNLMSAFYKDEYRTAELAAAILMLSNFMLGLFIVFNILICSTQNKAYSVVVGIVTVLLDALLCRVLIPICAINGAAAASLITNAIGVAFSIYKLKRIFGKIWVNVHTRLVVANVLLFAFAYVLGRAWVTNSFIITVLVCFLMYVLFCIGLIFLKIFPMKVIPALFGREKSNE